jgi:hypothetical protein
MNDKRWLDAVVSFNRLSKVYYRRDHLSSSRQRLLNLPDTNNTGRVSGGALGQRSSVKQVKIDPVLSITTRIWNGGLQ